MMESFFDLSLSLATNNNTTPVSPKIRKKICFEYLVQLNLLTGIKHGVFRQNRKQ